MRCASVLEFNGANAANIQRNQVTTSTSFFDFPFLVIFSFSLLLQMTTKDRRTRRSGYMCVKVALMFASLWLSCLISKDFIPHNKEKSERYKTIAKKSVAMLKGKDRLCLRNAVEHRGIKRWQTKLFQTSLFAVWCCQGKHFPPFVRLHRRDVLRSEQSDRQEKDLLQIPNDTFPLSSRACHVISHVNRIIKPTDHKAPESACSPIILKLGVKIIVQLLFAVAWKLLYFRPSWHLAYMILLTYIADIRL